MDMFVLFLCLLLSHGFARAQDDEEMEKSLAEEAETTKTEGPDPVEEAQDTKPNDNEQNKAEVDEETKKMLAAEADIIKAEKLEPAQEDPKIKPADNEQNKDGDNEEPEKVLAEEAKIEKTEISEPGKEAPRIKRDAKDETKDDDDDDDDEPEPGKEAPQTKPDEKDVKKDDDDKETEKMLAEKAETKKDEQPEPGKEAPQIKPDEEDKKEDEDDEEVEKMLAEDSETKKDEQPEPGKEAPQTKPDEKDENKPNTKQDKDAEQAKAPEADKSQGASGVQSPVVDDLTTLEVSNSVRKYIISDLPEELKDKVRQTDDAEKKVLTSYSKTQSVQKDVLDGYNAAKKEERTTLKKILSDIGSEAASLLVVYKALRNGKAWNTLKHDDRFVEFFKQPSTALTEYQSLKADETMSLESFLSSPSQDKTVSVNKRSLTAEAYEKAGVKTMERVQREEDVLERRLTDVGDIEGKSNEDAEREKGRIDTTRKTIGLLQDPLDEISAEEVTTKIANVQIIHENFSLVKFAILSSLVGALTVAFIIMSECRKQAAQWRRRNKRVHRDLSPDMEPVYADSQLYAHGTERLKSAHSSIPVTTVHDTPRP